MSGYERKKVWFLDVMRQVFDMMVDYPIAFFLNVIGLHEFPLGDDDPLDSKGALREMQAKTRRRSWPFSLLSRN